MKLESLDTSSGHIACVLLIFLVGVLLYALRLDYGKEVMAGALGSLWTLLQVHKGGTNIQPGVVNQAETITVTNPTPKEP
jgi:hypothetical protein